MKTIVLLMAISLFYNVLWAQPEKQNVAKVILLRDSLFWTAYNKCDVEHLQQFFADDVEFYHDRGGLTVGLQNLISDLRKNLCGNDNLRLRREAIEGTVKVYLLQDAGVTYGALISGEHVFYVSEREKNERLDGYGKFTDVWVLRDDVWKMSRILSYDHGPAPYLNKRKVVKLPENILDQLTGQYVAPHSGVCKVQREADLLHLLIGDQKFILCAQSDSMFFVKDRDLTFEFFKSPKGDISKMIVRENGNVVEEALRQN